MPYADRITVRNLLNHTSGLYDYLEDRTFAGQAYADPTRSWAPAELVGYAARFRLRASEVRTVLGHIGGFGGFRSALWYAPESGIVLALGVNQAATNPNILATRVLDAILTAQEH